MRFARQATLAAATLLLGTAGIGLGKVATTEVEIVAPEPAASRIQLAILLDTSGSMSGLIEQAKIQLWSIVNELVLAKHDGQRPQLRVALYEYGNDGLAKDTGWIRQVLPLTDDLDRVSEQLHALSTNGGQEYCGQVIDRAVKDLDWSASHDDLKLIFIAGNEPFSQGPVDYRDAVKSAISKGIIVNTIHCGSGIPDGWRQGAVLADGRAMNIDHNQAIVEIPTPHDQELAELGVALNDTYVPFGTDGRRGFANQRMQDSNSAKFSVSNMATRAVTKSGRFYQNSNWDLVDAVEQKKVELDKVKEEELPENMRSMTAEQKSEYLQKLLAQRKQIQDKISGLNEARTSYIAQERAKMAEAGEDTLDSAMVKAIRELASTKNYDLDE